MARIPKVAIACQGGGSHAAFAAGLLRRLLGTPLRERFELVAISGTSGGAMCAGLAWSGLVSSGPDEAARRLDAFWRDLEAVGVVDSIANFWTVTLARLPVTAEVSPYLYNPIAEPALRNLLRCSSISNRCHRSGAAVSPDAAGGRGGHPQRRAGDLHWRDAGL